MNAGTLFFLLCPASACWVALHAAVRHAGAGMQGCPDCRGRAGKEKGRLPACLVALPRLPPSALSPTAPAQRPRWPPATAGGPPEHWDSTGRLRVLRTLRVLPPPQC